MGSWPVVYEELLRCNWAKRSSKKYLTCCTETPAPWQLRFFSATVITPLRTASITNFPCCHSTGCTEIFPNREVPHTFQQKQCGSMRCLPDSSHRRYRSILVFGTPEDKWATWVSPLFPAFTYMLHSTVERVLNGPNIRDLRATDANMHMYSALTLQSFNRGHPMVPQSKPCEDSVTVAAGEHLGLVSWTRFKPHEKFHLSEYMRDLTERLGHQLQTYGVMDGRKLVRYQCVVVRQQVGWVEDTFLWSLPGSESSLPPCKWRNNSTKLGRRCCSTLCFASFQLLCSASGHQNHRAQDLHWAWWRFRPFCWLPQAKQLDRWSIGLLCVVNRQAMAANLRAMFLKSVYIALYGTESAKSLLYSRGCRRWFLDVLIPRCSSCLARPVQNMARCQCWVSIWTRQVDPSRIRRSATYA